MILKRTKTQTGTSMWCRHSMHIIAYE